MLSRYMACGIATRLTVGLWLVLPAIGPGVRSASGELELDLTAAIRYAQKQNRELVRTARLLKRGEIGLKNADLAFATRVKPQGSVTAAEDGNRSSYGLQMSKSLIWGSELSVDGTMSRTEYDSAGDELETLNPNRASVAVRLTQPLLRNFGRLVNGEELAQANSALRRVRRQYEEQKASLVVSIVSTFETLIRLEREIEADEAQVGRMDKLYRLTKARERQGHGTRVDSLRVELQLGQTKLRVANSRERLSSTQREFMELLGFAPDTKFSLHPPPLLKVDIPSPKEAVAIALRNRLDYAQVRDDHEDSKRAVRIARRNLYPDIALTGSYERFGEGETASEAANLDEEDWSVGLVASTDFNRRIERLGYADARLNERSNRDAVEIKELSIAREVQQGIIAFRRAQTSVRIAARNLKLADARVKLARRMFEMGRGDNFSVTDAEEAYARARNEMLNSTSDVSINGYRFLRSLGTLTEFPDELKARRGGLTATR